MKIFKNKLKVLVKDQRADLPCYLKSSKLGGLPYWPANLEKLKNDKLLMVAQINLTELNQKYDLKKISEFYPTKGILQFYCDDMFDEGKVIWHENIDEDCIEYNKDELKNIKIKYDNLFPINDSFLLEFSDKIILEIIDTEKENTIEEFTELFSAKIGGVAPSVQKDISEDDHNCRVPLLFLDSVEGEKTNLVDWGFGGVGYWHITLEDLKNKEFNKAEFYWDDY